MTKIQKILSAIFAFALVATAIAIAEHHRGVNRNVFGASIAQLRSAQSLQPSGPNDVLVESSLDGPLQSGSGAGTHRVIRSQAAASGSNALGGGMDFILGKTDGSGGGAPTNLFTWGFDTLVNSGSPPATGGYFNLENLTYNTGQVIIVGFGGGSDGRGTGVAAVEFAAASPIDIATENNSAITILPSNGTGHGQSSFAFTQDANNGPAVSFSNFGGSMAPALSGIIRLPWETSSSTQELVDQRNSANTGDLSWLSRQGGVQTYGSLSENHQSLGLSSIVSKVTTSGVGFTHITPDGTVATFASDATNTWIQGDTSPPSFDSWYSKTFHFDTTATTANQTIATLPIAAGTNTYALTHLRVTVDGLDTTNGNAISIFMPGAFSISGGVVTAIANAPSPTIDAHSTAATGTSPQFAISGTNVLVQVTPWSTNKIHWTVHPEHNLNAGQPPAPTAPPGSPAFWFRADLQGLGTATTLTDQSGSGHNLPVLVGGTSSVTSSSGPGGTLPSLVFTGASSIYGFANNLGLGTKNFTIAVVGKVASTGTSEAFCAYGSPAGGNGGYVGVDLDLTSSRSFDQPGSGVVDDSAATTSWEAWVFGSDSSGNLTLLVDGANQPLSPSNQLAQTPSAAFAVGGNNSGTAQLTGNIFEVVVYSSFQSSSAIYTYQHAITGL